VRCGQRWKGAALKVGDGGCAFHQASTLARLSAHVALKMLRSDQDELAVAIMFEAKGAQASKKAATG